MARVPSETLVTDLLVGAVAGAAAVWVMDRVDWFMHDNEDREATRRTWAVRPEGKDPAHIIASRVSRAAGGQGVPQGHPAGLGVHYGIGIAPAMAYAAVREHWPAVAAGRGLAYGLALFVVEDEIVNPLVGTAAPPQRYPWQAHARGLVAHLVLGFVTEAVVRLVNGPPRPRARADRR